jgi:type I restriction enzyme S subunit
MAPDNHPPNRSPASHPSNISSPEGAKESGALPSGWKWETIPDLVSDGGVFIDGDWVESKDQDPNGDVRLVQLADVGDGVYRDRSDRFMTKAKAEELRCTFLKDGDVLIARMPDPLGRACIFPGDVKPSVTVVDVAIVRSGNGEFDHRWLASFVNAHPFRSAISGLQAGSTRKRISRGNLATIALPVPPLPEQRRIVAEIEKHFTRLEVGVAALRRVQANLKRYRAAVLKAACEGRLVPTEAELAETEHREFETGEELLARILTERRRSWQGRGQYKEPAASDTTKLGPLPEGWTWATAEQLTSLVTSGSRGWGEFYSDSGPFFIRAQDIKTDSLKLAAVARVALPSKVEGLRSSVENSDLLVTITGANVTKSAIVRGLAEAAFVSQHVALLKPVLREASAFHFLWIVSPAHGRKILEQWAYGAGKPGLSLEQVRGLPVALPPLAEQTRIVAEVERRLSVVEELEAVVFANLQRATRLRQSVLQKAFEGALV